MNKLMLTILLTFSSLMIYAQESNASGYQPGDTARDFLLQNVDRSMVSLAKYKDAKGFIVIFTSNSCKYSLAYENRIIALNNEFKPKGYPVIAINPNDSTLIPDEGFDYMVARSQKKGFTFPYLQDADQKVYKVYGATVTPEVFILKKEKNNLIVKYIGAIDDNYADASKANKKYVEMAVNALLSGKDPDPDSTTPVGCDIMDDAHLSEF